MIKQSHNSIDSNKIYVVGNYNLLELGMKKELFNSYLKNFKNDILYIDSDSVFRTFNGNKDLYIEYIKKLNKIVENNGFKLHIKLHPLSIEKNLDTEIHKYNIKIVEQEEILHVLKKVKYVISEPSSITIIPCLMGIPLLTPILNPFNKKKYGTIINNYPSRLSFSSFKELDFMFKEYKFKTNKKKLEYWIRNHAGPLPPSEFSKRVLEIVKKIIY